MPEGLGGFGERWAAAYLARQGYVVLERNVRYRTGEIDLIASEGDDLVFVEVKTRRSTRFGPPEASLTPARLGRLHASIQHYLQDRGLEEASIRIDVVALELNAQGRVVRAHVIRGVEAA